MKTTSSQTSLKDRTIASARLVFARSLKCNISGIQTWVMSCRMLRLSETKIRDYVETSTFRDPLVTGNMLEIFMRVGISLCDSIPYLQKPKDISNLLQLRLYGTEENSVVGFSNDSDKIKENQLYTSMKFCNSGSNHNHKPLE